MAQIFGKGVVATQVVVQCTQYIQPLKTTYGKRIVAKGQLITKCLFGAFNSSKNEFGNSNFCPSLLGKKFFVCFLGELKKPKCPFEINWPLVHLNDLMVLVKIPVHIYFSDRVHLTNIWYAVELDDSKLFGQRKVVHYYQVVLTVDLYTKLEII